MVSVYIALRPLVSLPKAMNDILLLIHVVTLSITVGLKNECVCVCNRLLKNGFRLQENVLMYAGLFLICKELQCTECIFYRCSEQCESHGMAPAGAGFLYDEAG
jgi:uncharacterized membrane protein YciS (DUF1049 family)